MRNLSTYYKNSIITNNPVSSFLLKQEYTEFEGFVASGTTWVTVTNELNFGDVYAEGQNFRSSFDYNNLNHTSTMLVVEISQVLDNRFTKETKTIVSKLTVFDMASANILADNFRNSAASPQYKGMYSFYSMLQEISKANNNFLPTVYDGSVVTQLMKESIAGNSFNVAIFTLQQNDFAISNIVFKIMKIVSNIQCFPIVNESLSIGLLKKFRVEISYLTKFRNSNIQVARPIDRGDQFDKSYSLTRSTC